ncbi:MAG: GDP-mannose 4,6-dehydratase [Solirubrobacteraceae bacterium]
MRALVTGGAGFIGSNIVDALIERGDQVGVLDALSTGREAHLASAIAAGARLHVADIRDPAEVRAVFAREKPEVVFHLAAQIDVRKSLADPALDARINVEGTINVLNAARESGVRRFVNTSTGGAIYGDADRLPTAEDALPRPEAAYAQSKFSAEGYCALFQRLYALSTVTLRYGNVFGPRQDPLGEAGVVAIFCGKLTQGGKPTVFGSGEQTRDYVFVGDCVEANLLAAERDELHGPINIGTGRETSVLELLAVLGELGSIAEPTFEPARTGELDRSCLDVGRAQRELGWQARTGLLDGLRATLASL